MKRCTKLLRGSLGRSVAADLVEIDAFISRLTTVDRKDR